MTAVGRERLAEIDLSSVCENADIIFTKAPHMRFFHHCFVPRPHTPPGSHCFAAVTLHFRLGKRIWSQGAKEMVTLIVFILTTLLFGFVVFSYVVDWLGRLLPSYRAEMKLKKQKEALWAAMEERQS